MGAIGTVKQNHKYLQRAKDGDSYRYFYSQSEYDKFMKGGSSSNSTAIGSFNISSITKGSISNTVKKAADYVVSKYLKYNTSQISNSGSTGLGLSSLYAKQQEYVNAKNAANKKTETASTTTAATTTTSTKKSSSSSGSKKTYKTAKDGHGGSVGEQRKSSGGIATTPVDSIMSQQFATISTHGGKKMQYGTAYVTNLAKRKNRSVSSV